MTIVNYRYLKQLQHINILHCTFNFIEKHELIILVIYETFKNV